ncbi:hypothetical protein GW755_03025 [bacterium]|nr:hypothetical protein [bacterium]
MSTVVNNSNPPSSSNGGAGFLIGAALVIVLVLLLIFFGIPAIKNNVPSEVNVQAPQISVPVTLPDKVDVQVTPTE